ncbi:hypothetical protein QBE52_17885 [Clostridiaceae bacterium 35-E11]
MKKIIMGIQVGDRREDALEVQKLLTEYGCIIKTRLGLHDTGSKGNVCSEQGLIILEFIMEVEDQIKELAEKLKQLQEIKMNMMEF